MNRTKIAPEIERNCCYCEYSEKITMFGDDEMICSLRGVVSAGFKCSKFFYDPLKRNPCLPPKLPGLEQ